MVKVLKHYFNYSYIIYDPETGDAFLVDPSWNAENIDNNLSGLTLCGILLTHHHYDHVNLVNQIIARRDVPVFISKDEAEYYHFKCNNLTTLIDGENISLGNINVKSILTPGHTKGGMCYQIGNDLFTGDTLFIEGCGICQFDGGNPYEMFESIKKLTNLIPKENLVYPGHSYGKPPGIIFKYVLENNIYFHFEDSEKFVNFRMRKNQKNLFKFI